MTLDEFLQLCRERWRLLAGVVAAALATAGILLATLPPTYDARSTVFVSPSGAAPDASSSYEGNLLSAQRMSSYLELITSRQMAADVAARLDLATSPDELRTHIAAANAPETVLLQITVSDRSPVQAARIADAVSARFVDVVAELEQPDDPRSPPALVARVYEPATPPVDASFPSVPVFLGIGLAAGLVVALLAAAVSHSLDHSVRSARAVSRSTGTPVLAMLPAASRAQLSRIGAPSEEQRRLRARLLAAGVGNTLPVVALVAAADEPVAAVAADLAVSLSDTLPQVLIVDAGEPDGVAPRNGLIDVLERRCTLDAALDTDRHPRVDVLSRGASSRERSLPFAGVETAALLAELRVRYDVVLLVLPELLVSAEITPLLAAADTTVVLGEYGRTPLADLVAAQEAAGSAAVRVLGVLVTGAPAFESAARRRRRRTHAGGRRPPVTGPPTPRRPDPPAPQTTNGVTPTPESVSTSDTRRGDAPS